MTVTEAIAAARSASLERNLRDLRLEEVKLDGDCWHVTVSHVYEGHREYRWYRYGDACGLLVSDGAID